MSEKLDASQRWEQGIEHHPKSLQIQKGLQAQDTFGIWDWGGDGDNGENLLYHLDVIFAGEEEEIIKLKELMPVWVSVDERLPDDKQRVLYYFEYVGIHAGKYDSNDNCFYGSSGFLQDDVTHWMKLPPAPSEAAK